jgi:hypothetical protein
MMRCSLPLRYLPVVHEISWRNSHAKSQPEHAFTDIQHRQLESSQT